MEQSLVNLRLKYIQSVDKNMFNRDDKVLIFGYHGSHKTSLVNFIIDDRKENIVIINMFKDEKDLIDSVIEKNDIIVLENFSTKDKNNKTVLKLLQNKSKGVIVTSPYPLGIGDRFKSYFNILCIPKFDCYTISLIHNNYMKHWFKKEYLVKFNEELTDGEFLLFKPHTNNIGKICIKEKSFIEKIKNIIYFFA